MHRGEDVEARVGVAELTVTVTPGTPPQVTLSGEVDLATAPDFERAVNSLFSQGTASLAVDLSGVSYLDSTGVSVLMRAVKQCRDRGGDLSIVGVSDRALRVMKLLSLDRMVRLYPQGP
ncbi:MAG: STAS domain-containing protein [Armatimonadetes bacterium]|nr:STAS domain-containing protein [Armatimonadota bacterium]